MQTTAPANRSTQGGRLKRRELTAAPSCQCNARGPFKPGFAALAALNEPTFSEGVCRSWLGLVVTAVGTCPCIVPTRAAGLCVVPVDDMGLYIMPVDGMGLYVMPVDSVGLCVVLVDGMGLCIMPVDGVGVCVCVMLVDAVGLCPMPVDAVGLSIVPVDGVGLCVLSRDRPCPGGTEFDQRELPLEDWGTAALKGRGSGHLPFAHIWSRNGCTGLGTGPAPAPEVFSRFHGVGSTGPGFTGPPGVLPGSWRLASCSLHTFLTPSAGPGSSQQRPPVAA
jgi:hypothetical protein